MRDHLPSESRAICDIDPAVAQLALTLVRKVRANRQGHGRRSLRRAPRRRLRSGWRRSPRPEQGASAAFRAASRCRTCLRCPRPAPARSPRAGGRRPAALCRHRHDGRRAVRRRSRPAEVRGALIAGLPGPGAPVVLCCFASLASSHGAGFSCSWTARKPAPGRSLAGLPHALAVVSKPGRRVAQQRARLAHGGDSPPARAARCGREPPHRGARRGAPSASSPMPRTPAASSSACRRRISPVSQSRALLVTRLPGLLTTARACGRPAKLRSAPPSSQSTSRKFSLSGACEEASDATTVPTTRSSRSRAARRSARRAPRAGRDRRRTARRPSCR